MKHAALLDLPAELSSLGLNVVTLTGWEEAQGDYLWTDPLTEKKSYDLPPSCYMVHHTGPGAGGPSDETGAIATPVVRTTSGTWSKANAWLGLWDGKHLYQKAPEGKTLDPTIVVVSAGPARISSGYGFWPLAEDYLFRDIRAPYWDQPNSDTDRALNRYAFNVETVHSGDGGPIDPGVLEHAIGLGVGLHRLFGWKDRTTGHLTWTNRKIDPYWDGRRDAIVKIQNEVVDRLVTAPPIEPPPPGGGTDPMPPLNNVGRNMQYVREGDTGQEVEYWQVMAIQAVSGVLFYGTSNRTYIQQVAPQLEWKVWDAAMTSYLSAWTGRNSYGIGASERVLIEAEVDRLRRETP